MGRWKMKERTRCQGARWRVFWGVLLSAVLAVTLLAATGSVQAKATSTTYLLKVNRRLNVVTAYQRQRSGKYKAVRTMRVSCGRGTIRANTTPRGTFRIYKKEASWHPLYGRTWGRKVVRFYRDYLFHTVPYGKKGRAASMSVTEYRKLGRNASGGCVRMQYIDELWLYDHCPKGTKVVVYSSSRYSSLGRPGIAPLRTKKKQCYDPTDPVKGNRYYSTAAPKITVSKSSRTLAPGSAFDPKAGVKAKDARTRQDLTAKVRYTMDEVGEDGSLQSVKAIDTAKEGAVYKIHYTCYYKYCSKYTGKKTVTVTIGER